MSSKSVFARKQARSIKPCGKRKSLRIKEVSIASQLLFLLEKNESFGGRANYSQTLVDGSYLPTTVRMSQQYGTLAGVGGNTAIKKAYIELTPGKQKYDLMSNAIDAETSSSFTTLYTSGSTIDVTKVFYEATPAIARFFDPYSVGAQGTLNLMSELGFGNFSPAAQFLMMPLYEDVLRMQQIEFNDHIRKSAFSFNIVNNKLEIFPVPNDGTRSRIYYEYFERDTFENNSSIVQDGVVADYSNIRYEVSLDGAALRAEAQVEKDELVKQLRENLEELGRKNQFEIRKNEAEYHQDMLRKVPLKLYVG